MNSYEYYDRIFILIIIMFLNIINVWASEGDFSTGGRSAGIANSSVTIADTWSVFNNVGGISGVVSPSVLFFYENRYGVEGFSNRGCAFVMPIKKSAWGLSFYKFGDKIFSEQKAGLSFGHQMGIVSIGGQVNYLQYNFDELGSHGVMALEVGGIAEITPKLKTGIHIFNLNGAKISTSTGERVPVFMKMGVAYQPLLSLSILAEVGKEVRTKVVVKTGLEYQIIKKLFMRSGINLSLNKMYYGMGFQSQKMHFDYALSHHNNLGFTHTISLNYVFQKSKNSNKTK